MSDGHVYEIPWRDDERQESGWYATDEGGWLVIRHHAVPGYDFDKLPVPVTRERDADGRATGSMIRSPGFSPEERVRHWHAASRLALFLESAHPGNAGYPEITAWIREHGREVHPDPSTCECAYCREYRDAGWK